MSLRRWQVIKRYFKISNPLTDPTPNSSNWIHKIQPFLEAFEQASLLNLAPGRDVSINEQLILFKGRSIHSMRIDNKKAGQGFKVYTLCHGNYVIGLNFTSKASQIVGLDERLSMETGLPKTSAICVQLMKQLYGFEYICYLDNYFTRVPLLLELKKHGYAACGTSKKGSGIYFDLVTLRELSKKKSSWGIKSITTVRDEILCMSWQDHNTVLFMTTAHTIEDAQSDVLKDIDCRKGIPLSSSVWVDTEEKAKKGLPFPTPINDYNSHMGGSDGNAQQRATYTAEHHRDMRY